MTQAERNREQVPTIAGVMDEFRKVFGPGVQLKWAKENGNELGKNDEQEKRK